MRRLPIILFFAVALAHGGGDPCKILGSLLSEDLEKTLFELRLHGQPVVLGWILNVDPEKQRFLFLPAGGHNAIEALPVPFRRVADLQIQSRQRNQGSFPSDYYVDNVPMVADERPSVPMTPGRMFVPSEASLVPTGSIVELTDSLGARQLAILDGVFKNSDLAVQLLEPGRMTQGTRKQTAYPAQGTQRGKVLILYPAEETLLRIQRNISTLEGAIGQDSLNAILLIDRNGAISHMVQAGATGLTVFPKTPFAIRLEYDPNVRTNYSESYQITPTISSLAPDLRPSPEMLREIEIAVQLVIQKKFFGRIDK